MDLNKFASLIACNSTNIAKNTMSYLIGNGQSNKEWDEALSNLYKSFPKELKEGKKEKKEFLPVILKFFKTYEISKHNIDIFNEYSEMMSAEDKDKIKSKNSNWVWENEPEIIFKNSFAFTKAIGRLNPFDFIEKYQNQFNNFLKKDKEKIYQHFDSLAVWTGMIKKDYSKFVKFCDNYGFNHLNLLKENLNQYTHLSYLNVLNDKHIDLFLKDLENIGRKEIYEKMPQLFPNYIEARNNNESCFYELLKIVKENEYYAAIKFMDFFNKEISQYIKLSVYAYEEQENKNLSLNTSVEFKETLSSFKKYFAEYNTSTWNGNARTIDECFENKNWFNYLDKINLQKDLKEVLNEKELTTKRKLKL